MPRPSRTLRGAWIAEVENASSAAYLGLLLRFFDHHIAWITSSRRCFTKLQTPILSMENTEILILENWRLSRNDSQMASDSTVLAQCYRSNEYRKMESRKTLEGKLAHKDSPPKMKVEKSAEEKNEGAEDAAMPIKETKDDEEAPVQPVEEKKDEEKKKAPVQPVKEKKDDEEAPAQLVEEKQEDEEAPAQPVEEKKRTTKKRQYN